MTAKSTNMYSVLSNLADKVGENLARDAVSELDPRKAAEKLTAARKVRDLSAALAKASAEQERKSATRRRVAEERTAAGRPVIDPLDASAPVGTHIRRIRAYNALMDLAVVGRDRICGKTPQHSPGTAGPCVLREGHAAPEYDDHYPDHMDAEQRDRAERYLTHSDPDPDRRA
jgi:hypothetical protein